MLSALDLDFDLHDEALIPASMDAAYLEAAVRVDPLMQWLDTVTRPENLARIPPAQRVAVGFLRQRAIDDGVDPPVLGLAQRAFCQWLERSGFPVRRGRTPGASVVSYLEGRVLS